MGRGTIIAIAVAAVLAGGAAAAVIVLAGSQGDPTTTVQQVALRTTSDLGKRTKTVTVTTTDTVPSPPPLDVALADVSDQGFDVSDSSTYDASQPVAVLLGVASDSADGRRQQAFFFADGRYLGTDTKETSAGISFEYQRGSTIALNYELFDPQDAMCCPSAGTATVEYHWTGDQLVPLDSIPTNYDSAYSSRR